MHSTNICVKSDAFIHKDGLALTSIVPLIGREKHDTLVYLYVRTYRQQ